MIFLFNNHIYTLPINGIIAEKIKNIGLFLLLFLAVGQYVSNAIVAFGNIKFLDKKMQIRPIDNSYISNYINYFLIIIYLVGFLIMYIFKLKQDYVFLEMVTLSYVTLGIEAVYCSFISVYVKIRRWYYVDEINIRTKSNNRVYKSVFNYKKIADTYEFVYEDEKILKRVKIPSDDLELIEKRINTKKTFLELMKKN